MLSEIRIQAAKSTRAHVMTLIIAGGRTVVPGKLRPSWLAPPHLRGLLQVEGRHRSRQ